MPYAQCLVFDLYGAALAGDTRHPQHVMRDLGITYQVAVPQSLGDCWWFFNCENVPEQLPAHITSKPLDDVFFLGHGLSKADAQKIHNYVPKAPSSLVREGDAAPASDEVLAEFQINANTFYSILAGYAAADGVGQAFEAFMCSAAPALLARVRQAEAKLAASPFLGEGAAPVSELIKFLEDEIARLEAQNAEMHKTQREEDVAKCRFNNAQLYAYNKALKVVATGPAAPAAAPSEKAKDEAIEYRGEADEPDFIPPGFEMSHHAAVHWFGKKAADEMEKGRDHD